MTPSEIKAARARLGLSQAKLAAALPAATRTVEDWEAGRRTPPDYLERALRDLEAELARR